MVDEEEEVERAVPRHSDGQTQGEGIKTAWRKTSALVLDNQSTTLNMKLRKHYLKGRIGTSQAIC
jgi:hypothetical protein